MTAQVLSFPQSAVSTFDEAWRVLPQTMKTRSESRRKLAPLWNDHARRIGGHDVLLAALQAYLKGDKDLPKSGGPGLQVWLRAERYDHWLEGPSCSVFAEPEGEDRVQFPEPFRTALVQSCGEGWVRSYIDQCSLEGTVLIVPEGKHTAASRIREKARDMKAAGLTALRMGVD